MESTFYDAAKFKGTGVEKWKPDMASVDKTLFYGAISVPACTKWLIVRNWPENTKVRTVYPTWDSICKPGGPTTNPTSYVGFDACMKKKTDEGKEKCNVRVGARSRRGGL